METYIFRFLSFIIIFRYTLQDCPEEISYHGITVTWHETKDATNVKSEPLCYCNETLITRNCTNSTWVPELDDTQPCMTVIKYFDLSSCPPGYHRISEENSNYCFQIGESSAWNFPCFTSGGASVITDLTDTEIEYLITSLTSRNLSRYLWLPAQRQKLFNPVVWYTPGPNRGMKVASSNNSLPIVTPFYKNCLLLDTKNRIITTDFCSNIFPSLCFYLSDLHYPAKCPDGYQSFRFKPNNASCFGIEKSENKQGLSFSEFLQSKCKKPMTNSEYDLTRFIFKKIAEMNNMSDDLWCWFGIPSSQNDYIDSVSNTSIIIPKVANFQGIINNAGALSLMLPNTLLSCMACEADLIYAETELMFEYNEVLNKMYLTVYYPSGLWKYDNTDKGIQCFSDAKGFVRVIDVDDTPVIDVNVIDVNSIRQKHGDIEYIEKIVYVIDLVTESSAQYWCEGHTLDFSLITTDKIIVNPSGNKIHVFSLVIQYYILESDIECIDNLTNLVINITEIFDARKVLIMEILNYIENQIMILFHLHIDIDNTYEDEANNLLETFHQLELKIEKEFPKYNYSFVNMSSSIYCLPTISNDIVTLEWELTPLGHVSAPKQFCLQSNGLPVKRHCRGSYNLGGYWSEVDGTCDTNYKASETTAYLYNFVKRQMPQNHTSRFLIDGLNFVLNDTDIIIPADIYYLSVSLQQILDIAHDNDTFIDTGDIENIAWVMDRVMILDYDYLNLAQTLNSTNVILDSLSDIIEIIAQKDLNETCDLRKNAYRLAVMPQFVVQITYPDINNITGIAICRTGFSDEFTDMTIKPLYNNSTLDEVLAIEHLEIATWLPTNLINTLLFNRNDSQKHYNKTEENFHVIITIFHNNAIFQELSLNNHLINSRIVGISIPGYVSNLKYPVPIILKKINNTSTDSFCGYWDFNSDQNNHIPGIWKRQGCFMVKSINDITVCECYHLTHFGQLLAMPNIITSDDNSIEKHHSTALNIITLIGSFLSLLGIFGIWITALVFSSWRKKAGTKVLLQLSTAIALPLIFVVVFNLDTAIFIEINGEFVVVENMKSVCIVLGALLHFSILASFVWMAITAVLQFIRYVRVLGVHRPSRFMIKFTLVGWGIPLIPVIITLALDTENYVPDSSRTKKICYPNGSYFIAGVFVPICIILLINVILFIIILNAIARGPDQKIKTTDMDLVRAQLRVSIFLFFLLGLTWVFAILSFSNNMIWSYLFCLTSTLQGFVLFIYFIICDPTTRNLWITLMKPQFTSNSSRNSVTSLSAATGF